MASCSLCVNESADDEHTFKVSQFVGITLPYYREIVNYLPSPISRSNYTPYHIFCLKNNISPFITSIDSAYYIGFSTRENKNVMSVTMDIYKGGDKVILKDEVLHLINKNLYKFIDLYPYCLVYDVSYNEYPERWLRNILPKLNIGMYKNGSIFVDLDGVSNFNTTWQNMYDKINETLAEYYNKGIISLDGISNGEDLITRWNLIRLNNGLYQPKWEYNFTPDKVSFIFDQASKNTNSGRLMLYVGEDSVMHTYEGWLVQTVHSYKEVVDIIESIFSN